MGAKELDAVKRTVIEAAGWKVGDAADFLEMNDEERRTLDVRTALEMNFRERCPPLSLSDEQ